MQVPCTGLDQLWRAYEVFEQQGSSRALSRRVLEQQRPQYQAARTALGPRTRLHQPLNPAALPFTPGTLSPCLRTAPLLWYYSKLCVLVRGCSLHAWL